MYFDQADKKKLEKGYSRWLSCYKVNAFLQDGVKIGPSKPIGQYLKLKLMSVKFVDIDRCVLANLSLNHEDVFGSGCPDDSNHLL